MLPNNPEYWKAYIEAVGDALYSVGGFKESWDDYEKDTVCSATSLQESEFQIKEKISKHLQFLIKYEVSKLSAKEAKELQKKVEKLIGYK